MDTEFRTVTRSNLTDVLGLTVLDEQEDFIESMEECIQDAQEDERYVPLGLYCDGEIVGFAMYGQFKGRVWFDRFLIDQKYQGQGLGKHFFRKMLDYLGARFDSKYIYLSVYEENQAAIQLYESFGFEFTDEMDVNGEMIMRKNREKMSKPMLAH